jgi:hypothetical protein
LPLLEYKKLFVVDIYIVEGYLPSDIADSMNTKGSYFETTPGSIH